MNKIHRRKHQDGAPGIAYNDSITHQHKLVNVPDNYQNMQNSEESRVSICKTHRDGGKQNNHEHLNLSFIPQTSSLAVPSRRE